MINSQIDILEAIKLANSRKTTVDDFCKFIYTGIREYQEEREIHYLEQLKFEFGGSSKKKVSGEVASEHAENIAKKIETDTQKFSVAYAKNSIDAVLDAINEKKFKTKQGPQNLLVLLTTLQEMNED